MKPVVNRALAGVVALFLLFSACNSSRTVKGAGIGAGAGAAIGAAIGSASGNTAKGAIIGAAIGGVGGAAIGRYMDKQAQELQRDLKDAKVERVGEGIKITFNSGILFNTNSFEMQSAAYSNLNSLSTTLQKYEDTNILIEGHTDNTGEDAYNQTLSEKRAATVATYLRGKGVAGTRITQTGYGETQPVQENDSEVGKQANRRVEVAIFANEKLKKAAKRGDI